jgi:hypothetical protein
MPYKAKQLTAARVVIQHPPIAEADTSTLSSQRPDTRLYIESAQTRH